MLRDGESRVYEYVSLEELPEEYRQIANGGAHGGIHCGCDHSPWTFFLLGGLVLVPLGLVGFTTLWQAVLALLGNGKVTLFDTYIGGAVGLLFVGGFLYWVISSVSRFRHSRRRQLGLTRDGLYVLPEALFFHFSKGNNWLIPHGRLKDVQSAITYRSDNTGRPAYSKLLAYVDNENSLVRFPFDEIDKLGSDVPALSNILKLWCTDPRKAIKIGKSGRTERLPDVETVDCS